MLQSYSPGGANVPFHEGTLAPPCKYDWIRASYGPAESTTQTASRSVQTFLHSSRQKDPVLYNGRIFPTKLPLRMGGSGPSSNTWFAGSIRTQNPHWISISSAFFAQMNAWCLVSLYFTMGRPFPTLKIVPSHGSVGPPKSSIQTASRSVQPFLQGSIVWQTDRPHYSVGNNRPHLHCVPIKTRKV